MSLIFLVGGAFEGKEAYAKAQYPNAEMISDYHEKVLEQLKAGQDPMTEIERLLQKVRKKNTVKDSEIPEKSGNVVLISDEIGCGIIPLDPMERKWREFNGRVNCRIASEADQVIRIIAGIPQRLK